MIANLLGSAGTFQSCVAEKASFVFLHQIDLLLTTLAVSLGLYELNPLIRNLLTAPVSPVLLLLLKVAIPLFIAWLAPGKLLLPAIIFLSLVVAWNIKEILIFLL